MARTTPRRLIRTTVTLAAVCTFVVGGGFLLVPAEAHGFPPGIPVTCGGPYRLLSGDWMHTGTEGGVEFTAALRAQWERECRNQAARQVAIGLGLVVVGGYLLNRRRRLTTLHSAAA